MLIVALESATSSVGVAIVSDGTVLCSRAVSAPRSQTETLHPLLCEVLDDAGLSIADCEGVAVDLGPGLFTGLRVGLAAAKTLAFARRVPLAGCTSTGALLLEAQERHPGRPAVAVVDVRRSEVAFATSDAPGQTVLASPDGCVDALADRTDLAGATLCGDGALRYAPALRPLADKLGLVTDAELSAPSPAAVGRIGAERISTGEVLDPLRAQPVYLRAPDARIGWATRPTSA